MRKTKLLIGASLFISVITSCSYDNEEEYYSIDKCDLTGISFAETIDPIIDRNCKGCHYEGNSTGVSLVTYNNIVDAAENGKLLGTIKHLPGFEPMPRGGKLDDCSIQKIEQWINDGTPQN